ncbi:MAG: bifunctional [glutamate--ammonia ligase]-adenylyl-L-tyrosine phosphorylase/[glutamate--ammonia-ligase] adenylyltransferase, partial [Nevskiales bacterium]
MQKPDLSGLPEILGERVSRHWQSWGESAAPCLPEPVFAELAKVWACSNFVAQSCLRDPGLLPVLVDASGCIGAFDATAVERIHGEIEAATDEATLKRVLRECRRRELVRIAWRDLSGGDALDQTLLSLSLLADTMIAAALDKLEVWLAERHGRPQSPDGMPVKLVVLGMGKLGGGELNLSSDIDLIFCYEHEGETKGRKSISHGEYFETLARKLAQALSDRTEDGIAYRVDTLLRPFGSAGPLAMSFNAMEHYYQTHGREWERYALIKARPVAGDIAAGGRLLAVLKPFVYRRYLDYGAFESLRHVKALIHQDAVRRGSKDDIKLGRGGIREIEFIAQLFQLIRGGQERRLQQRSLRTTLRVLGELSVLPAPAVTALDDAYVFLRRLENRLQAYRDEQTHALPHEPDAQAALALAMGYADWPTLSQAIATQRREVEGHFERVFAMPQAAAGDERGTRLTALWQDELAPEAAAGLLQEIGFKDPPAAIAGLTQWRSRLRYRTVGELGRQRLAQCMPLILAAAAEADEPDTVLNRIADVLVAIAGRSAYLALLLEHPGAISQLIRLCGASPWIAEQLAQHPQLLDTLLDPRQLYAPPRQAELAAELKEWMDSVPIEDTEQHMELLRRFKHTQVLRVAAADVSGSVPLMVVSDHLTEIAEVVLAQTLDVSTQQLAAKHGRPRYDDGDIGREAGFAVIGYGKLGGLELGYGSDLDLVFVHEGAPEALTDGDKPMEQGLFFARVAQRMVHLLTTAT